MVSVPVLNMRNRGKAKESSFSQSSSCLANDNGFRCDDGDRIFMSVCILTSVFAY